ncbi:MAG: MliC family protein [Candidatus Thiodiazotropha sp.]
MAYDDFISLTGSILFMCKLITVMILSSVLVGCATVENHEKESHARLVLYDCTNGESLSVRYLSSEQSADLLHRGVSFQMKQQPSGSGFVYSSGPNTIRGKGDDLVVEIGRMVPLRCQAR